MFLWRASESWCSDDLLNLVHEWNKCICLPVLSGTDCKGLLIYSHCATLLMVITFCRWWLWAAHRDVALFTLHAVCWYITFWWEWQIDCLAQQKPFIKSKVEQPSPNCNHNSFASHRLPGRMNMQPFLWLLLESFVLMWFVRARAVAVTWKLFGSTWLQSDWIQLVYSLVFFKPLFLSLSPESGFISRTAGRVNPLEDITLDRTDVS